MPIFTKTKQQAWFNSMDFPEADIAVIPIPQSVLTDGKVFVIEEKWTKGDVILRPAFTITLIGYPYNYYDKKNCLPIWKTGSIASEPNVDFDGKPLFLVDVSAFPGMSGSPAFAITHGAFEKDEGTVTIGHVQKFLGIFASMPIIKENKYLEEITSDVRQGFVLEQSIQIGHIWKADLITSTVKSIDVPRYETEVLRNL